MNCVQFMGGLFVCRESLGLASYRPYSNLVIQGLHGPAK